MRRGRRRRCWLRANAFSAANPSIRGYRRYAIMMGGDRGGCGMIPDELQSTWTAVDEYIDGQLVASDAVLDFSRQTSEAAGLPQIAVTPSQGKLLHLLA